MLPTLMGKTDPQRYNAYLEEKTAHIVNLLRERGIEHPAPVIHAVPAEHYRMRAEFSLYYTRENGHNSFDYVMYEKRDGNRQRITLSDFPPGHAPMSELMRPLKERIIRSEILFWKVFQIDFLTNREDECVITLHYHKKLDEERLKEELDTLRDSLCGLGFKVMGLVAHARKQVVISGSDRVLARFNLAHGRSTVMEEVEGTFSQPNAYACEAMLNFACKCAGDNPDDDLLELYCGSGTFTVALAPHFRKVLATEVSRLPTATCQRNLTMNGIENTSLVRLSAVEVSEALNHVRPFKRLYLNRIDLDEYNFRTLFIDPPREGLRYEEALRFTASFDRIIYISCGMDSLVSDLAYLTKTHRIEALSLFDQFPYTPHLESGVLLTRRDLEIA